MPVPYILPNTRCFVVFYFFPTYNSGAFLGLRNLIHIIHHGRFFYVIPFSKSSLFPLKICLSNKNGRYVILLCTAVLHRPAFYLPFTYPPLLQYSYSYIYNIKIYLPFLSRICHSFGFLPPTSIQFFNFSCLHHTSRRLTETRNNIRCRLHLETFGMSFSMFGWTYRNFVHTT
jgi:hypothetical protein